MLLKSKMNSNKILIVEVFIKLSNWYWLNGIFLRFLVIKNMTAFMVLTKSKKSHLLRYYNIS